MSQAADAAVFALCVALLLAYNILYFTRRARHLSIKFRGVHYVNLWGVGLAARTIWASAIMADKAEGLAGTQNVRNMVMGVSILAAGAALLAAQIMQIMTDPARLAQLERYSTRDPIAGPGPSWMPADTKLALALGLLFIALMALAQCVRLSVHLGYLLRAAPADPKRGARLRRIAFSINRRASLFFSVGLRFLYAFFPIFLYILGPLALLIATLVQVAALFLMDLTPEDAEFRGARPETEDEVQEEMEAGAEASHRAR